MKITGLESNSAILHELGSRVRRARIEMPLTQQELASKAGLSLKTISNLEGGGDVRLGSLVAVLRVLGLLPGIDAMLPEPQPRLADLGELGHARQRATSLARRSGDGSSVSWHWGDER